MKFLKQEFEILKVFENLNTFTFMYLSKLGDWKTYWDKKYVIKET